MLLVLSSKGIQPKFKEKHTRNGKVQGNVDRQFASLRAATTKASNAWHLVVRVGFRINVVWSLEWQTVRNLRRVSYLSHYIENFMYKDKKSSRWLLLFRGNKKVSQVVGCRYQGGIENFRAVKPCENDFVKLVSQNIDNWIPDIIVSIATGTDNGCRTIERSILG